MAISARSRKPLRTLTVLVALIVALYGVIVAASTWGTGSFTPKLGLDLEGGTQMVLEPRLVGKQTVTQSQLDQARDIIVQRVDSNGISGAEVTTQGGRNIIVSMPGVPDRATEEAIRKSSQMQFRPVLAAGSGAPVPTPTSSATGTGTATTSPTGTATVPKASSSATTSSSKSALPGSLLAATSSPTATATPAPSASKSAPTGSAAPKDATDLAWITPELQAQFTALDCTKPGALDNLVDDPAKPLVTCDDTGYEKFILGPVVVGGDQIGDASAGYQTSQTGQPTSVVEIALTLKGKGKDAYAKYSTKMVSLPSPQNRLAATLDSRVIVAPAFQSAILDGRASITGGFSIESARALANQLKFGALPMSFDLQTRAQISPTLGGEQLRLGLLAGLIGLLLVVMYSLFQYHALGMVTVASLVIAAGFTYGTITLLGWSHNLRLDMAGVTGLIVAIGVTADSFIVYFERVRDEVREGRPLRAAVEAGWGRARRTILAADGVNVLAASILYLLASSNVRGFAFTLGLTTIIDLVVVMLFTHPMVALLAGTEFFGGGHRWSGLDPERLGAKIRYAGRGRVTIADSRRAAAEGKA
ncbi:MAG TPA: protein translocase subunit SecD [Dermatophilaceae bacterium]|nr:protein translocase subunit SecD [Dermatophilaceae bacterium]